ncbi:MAG TPA: ABC transporter substrate-binding protein [Verrucomicrobiae bacterium]|jgi:peptide/nickel transport system substrate-binding protein|nr:ABC transporter substrate-binding protein [Verrucomicrobiae bacterium]
MWPSLRPAILLLAVNFAASSHAQAPAELHFCLHGEPKTFNPLLVDDEASENIRYLTGGVLIRVNRQTQALEPGLAESWRVSPDGRQITFQLRKGIYFSDGSRFSSEDVAYTMRLLMDPQTHSATGDAFRSGSGTVVVKTPSPYIAVVTFPAPVAGMERLFDQVAILSAKSPKKEQSVLGPYYVSEYKAGSYVLLRRNPNYWRHDAQGRQLPYIDTVRLDIQRNRDIEMMRFRRGELQLVNRVDAQQFDELKKENPAAARNAGTGLDGEELWFNQAASSTLPDFKKKWFQSTDFRRAVSLAINREDLARVVFAGYATPAFGPVSPSNQFWFNAKLPAPKHDPKAALALIAGAGFQLQNGTLKDSMGNRVEFTLITNSGNAAREKMATMIQQDLSDIGISVKVVTLDFPSLIERITRTFDYDACLLGLVNTDLDPNSQMTVWLSSGENHQWNPNQQTPATAWEAEIDQLMREETSLANEKLRKAKFDRVQEIVAEQQPFIYLVNKNALSAVSAQVIGASPVALNPQTFWNIDTLRLDPTQQIGSKQ